MDFILHDVCMPAFRLYFLFLTKIILLFLKAAARKKDGSVPESGEAKSGDAN